jgi:hypothetical protein
MATHPGKPTDEETDSAAEAFYDAGTDSALVVLRAVVARGYLSPAALDLLKQAIALEESRNGSRG